MSNKISWAFFGSSHFSVIVLDELETLGLVPNLIVTTEDKPKGRGLALTPGEVKEWAEKRNIPVLTPASLKNSEIVTDLQKLGTWDVFLVASYGKIIPAHVFEIPKRKTLNIHPSLLPQFRGPTPLESAILNGSETGVTIMKIDEQVDHGDIVAQKKVPISDWPPYYKNLEEVLAKEGAKLFSEVLPAWIEGKITAQEQEHEHATFTKKFSKADLLISLSDDTETNVRKIRAFSENRGAYFISTHQGKDIRVIVTQAKIENGLLVLERVKPEGKKEMNYEDFKRGLKS